MKKQRIFLFLSISAFLFASTHSEGQIITTVAGSAPPNNIQATAMGMEIMGAVADKHGNLYVSDISNAVVRKVNISSGMATIIAGIGNYGYSGDGGLAINASFIYPTSLGIDTAGNIYIYDGARIRMINITTGIITTVAGNGTYGYSGDGGPAIAAEFGSALNIGFDKNNNMYIADFDNQRVRKINAATRIITTIAGTGTGGYNGDNIIATTAELYYPAGICVDDSGNVYIAEQTNFRVRKVDSRTGIITTIAGTGTPGYNGDNILAINAELYCPISVETDKTGNLYIADWGNNRVRKVNTQTGIITTVAGNGTLGHTGDGGLATLGELENAYGVTLDTLNNLYIVEGFNPVTGFNAWIRKVDALSQDISTIVGNGNGNYTGDGISATSAQLCTPSGLKVDASGNIYVADWGNNRIRKINGAGMISTYAGNGTWGFKNDFPADSGELFAPNDLAFDKAGNMYIADEFNDRIRKVNVNDTLQNFAGNGYGAPYTGYDNGNNGQAILAELYYPGGVAVDDSGSVYIADTYNNVIRKVNWKTGIITTIAGTGTAGYNRDNISATTAELNYPMEVAVDDSGNVFIADADNYRIRKITYATGIISTIAGTGTSGYTGDGGNATLAQLDYPIGVTLDINNVLYITDAGNSCIRTVDPATHIINTIAGTGTPGFSGDGGNASAAELDNPENVAFDTAGNMYIADNGNNRIRKVSHVVSLGVNKTNAPTAEVNLYPNPSGGIFQLEITNEKLGMNSIVQIYTMLGEKVYSKLTMNNGQLTINISGQPNGVYLYRVIAENGSLVGEGKLVIEK